MYSDWERTATNVQMMGEGKHNTTSVGENKRL